MSLFISNNWGEARLYWVLLYEFEDLMQIFRPEGSWHCQHIFPFSSDIVVVSVNIFALRVFSVQRLILSVYFLNIAIGMFCMFALVVKNVEVMRSCVRPEYVGLIKRCASNFGIKQIKFKAPSRAAVVQPPLNGWWQRINMPYAHFRAEQGYN